MGMKVIRILEGERYTAKAGTGYVSATAGEDGFEIDDRGAVFFVTDAQLNDAIQERNRTVEQDREETEADALKGVEILAELVAHAQEPGRCLRCLRPGSEGVCLFDCSSCYRCKSKIPDGASRLFTTADRVYCLDCGTHV